MSQSLLTLLGASATRQLDNPSGGNGNADHAQMQGALDDLGATGGVVLYSGAWWTDQTLQVPDGVHLAGRGRKASQLHRDGFDDHMITGYGDTDSAGLFGFLIDGHYEDNPGAVEAEADNIHIATGYTALDNYFGGSYWQVEQVWSVWSAHNGIHMGAVEGRVTSCKSFGSRGANYSCSGSDQFFLDDTSGACEGHGFDLQGHGHRLTACKSWWSGATSNRAQGIIGWGNYSAASNGFYLAGSNYSMGTCEAQDSGGSGLVYSATAGKVSCHIDAAGAAFTGSGASPHAALTVAFAQDAWLEVTTGNGTSHPNHATGWPAKIGPDVHNTRVDVWASPGHLEHPAALHPDSAFDASNRVTLQGLLVTG